MNIDDIGIEAFSEKELSAYFDYVRQPSISAQGVGIQETVAILKEKFAHLHPDDFQIWHEFGGNPVLFASFKGQSDQTVLFYNHYDVQPPEPLEEWLSPAFEPAIRDGKIFARGISDDKGELISRLIVLDYMQKTGALPINVKFVLEGEEEIGSPNISKYLDAHKKELAADLCIWEGGEKNEFDQFQVQLGSKGIAAFEMSVQTANKDIHSRMGGVIENAAKRLIAAIASLMNEDGSPKISHLRDDAEPLTSKEQDFITSMPFDQDLFKKTYGLLCPLISRNPQQELVNGNTLTISGFQSGYTGPGVKTIIPKSATAKGDIRLVPGQKPERVIELLKKQLADNGFSDVQVMLANGTEAYRSSSENTFVQAAIRTARKDYGQDIVVVPNMSGAGPSKAFNRALHVPIIMVGVNYVGKAAHSPNENIRLNDFKEGSKYLRDLLTAYALI
ncbi:MAG: M20/M25/M40 family metallo-hydrolase [Oenococcus sp.]|uniref:M20/M25/M40 family metallo-hydrolase n=1 Tax=Oenococcus sp. TaxID=1979414 RepID=UPI0039EB98E8